MWMLCYSAGRTVRPLGVELQEWLFGLCRRTALHSASLNGHTETALALVKAGADVHCKTNDGYASRAVSSGRLVCHSAGRTVRPIVTELRECLFGLCRFTALHDASGNGHTETALALVKAGADVHCKTNDGYGSRGCILVSVGF
jgi:ankyrin repeat protein